MQEHDGKIEDKVPGEIKDVAAGSNKGKYTLRARFIDVWAVLQTTLKSSKDILDFPRLTKFMRLPALLEVTRKFYEVLQRIYKKEMPNAKVERELLLMLLINKFPQDILGPGEPDLLARALCKDAETVLGMLRDMDLAPLRVNRIQRRHTLDRLNVQVEKYRASLIAWKDKDLAEVTKTLKAHYKSWLRSERYIQSAELPPSQKDELLQALRENTADTERKLTQVLGKQAVASTIAELREQVNSEPVSGLPVQHQPTDDHSPRKRPETDGPTTPTSVPTDKLPPKGPSPVS